MRRTDEACDRCGLTGVPIAYGMPTPETLNEVEAGRLVLGGCGIEPGLPTMTCRSCNYSWGSLNFGRVQSPRSNGSASRGEGPAFPEGHFLRGEAARLLGIDAEVLKTWHGMSRAGSTGFDSVSPSAEMYLGKLKVCLYTQADLDTIRALIASGEVVVMTEHKPVVLEGWRYEWDYKNDKYVTTDYITTDENYSYAVTRIGWLGRSRSGYKVWNTATGLTEGIFSAWGEARLKAIELATRANAPLPQHEPEEAPPHAERPADDVVRATPPTQE